MNDLKEFADAIGKIQGGGSDGGSTGMQGLVENTPLVVFVRRLWEMVTDGVIIHWHHTGLAIVVNIRVYETNVRRLYSKHNRTNKFSFFHRQLTCHGFIRLTRDHLDDCLATDPRLAVFFHSSFHRDKPDLLWKIRSLRRVEINDRANTRESYAASRDRQTVGFVPLTNPTRTAAGEPGYGEVPGGRPAGMAVPHIPEGGRILYRGISTSQPSARGQQAFVDGPRRSFERRQMPPPTCAAKRRRAASIGSRQRPSHMIPIARLPEIIFVPHLVTVNGLVPLEPCYDSWKNASLQKDTPLRPWTKRGPFRGSQGDGDYVMRHPSFPACPHPMTVPRDITPSTASCDVTAGFTGGSDAAVTEQVMCSRGNTCTNDNALGTVRYCSNGGSTGENNDRPLQIRVSVKRGAHFEDEEPLETRVSSDEDTKKGGCVETPAKIELSLSTTDAASQPCLVFDPSPLSVWQRPPADMDPFVKLDKLPL